MQGDVPAAHSMDTMWFAVDADGNVGAFETGEAGAVPVSWPLGQDATFTLLPELVRRLPNSDVVYVHAGHVGEGDEVRHAGHWMTRHGAEPAGVLLFLDDDEPVSDLLKAGKASLHAADVGVAVIVHRATPAILDPLHTAALCRGCVVHFDDQSWLPDPAAVGMFVFNHLTDNWIAGPYGLTRMPARPITRDALPEVLRDIVPTLPLSFRDSHRVQPFEHMECTAWNEAWLGTDGVTHGDPDDMTEPTLDPITMEAQLRQAQADDAEAATWLQRVLDFFRRDGDDASD